MRNLVLASSSPRRKEILERAGLKFIVDPGDYEEDMAMKLKPKELAKFLSRKKVESVAGKHKNAVVIGADTFIAYRNHLLGKPHTPEKARTMLSLLNGTTHSVITGFTIVDTKTKKRVSKAIENKVSFRKISRKEIEAYIKTGEPLERAGAYAIQERGAAFVKKIEGDFFGVMGLPIYEVLQELKKFGVSPF